MKRIAKTQAPKREQKSKPPMSQVKCLKARNAEALPAVQSCAGKTQELIEDHS